MIEIVQTPSFIKSVKKLTKQQKLVLDKAVATLIKNPEVGEKKMGDLSEVWVYKFKMIHQEYLLAYQWNPKKRILLALGVHENFYRDLKRK